MVKSRSKISQEEIERIFPKECTREESVRLSEKYEKEYNDEYRRLLKIMNDNIEKYNGR